MVTIPEIFHDEKSQKFILVVDDKIAQLEYHLANAPVATEHKQIIDFTRTYVPAEHRGRGYAEHLVRHGLKWAREQGFEIHASCWYVRKFLG